MKSYRIENKGRGGCVAVHYVRDETSRRIIPRSGKAAYLKTGQLVEIDQSGNVFLCGDQMLDVEEFAAECDESYRTEMVTLDALQQKGMEDQ